MTGCNVEHYVDDRLMVGYLSRNPDTSKPGPAILIAHEGQGLDQHVRDVADRLANIGYTAFAMDYHGDSTVHRGIR